MDYVIIKKQLLKEIRGKYSQTQMNMKLGYDFNQYSKWEKGNKRIYWNEFMDIVKALKIDIQKVIIDSIYYKNKSLKSKHLINYILREKSTGQLLDSLPITKSRLGRIRTTHEATIEEIFVMINHHYPLRLKILLKKLCKGKPLPYFLEQENTEAKIKELVARVPETPLCFLYLCADEYQKLKKHKEGYIAKKLNISLSREKTIIKELQKIEVLDFVEGKYIRKRRMAYLMEDIELLRTFMSYRAKLALDYINSRNYEGTESDTSSFDILASDKVIEQIRVKKVEFINDVLNLIFQDKEEDKHVRVINLQLIDPEKVNR